VGVKIKIKNEKCEQTGRIEKIKTHLVGNKFAGEKGAKQKSRIARSGNGDDEFSAFSYFFLCSLSPI
jgi:hypothetical protein